MREVRGFGIRALAAAQLVAAADCYAPLKGLETCSGSAGA